MNIRSNFRSMSFTLAASLLFCLLLVSCSEHGTNPEPGVVNTSRITVHGQAWRLYEIEDIASGDREQLADHELYTLDLRDSTIVTGLVGCDDYVGSYVLDSTGTASITDILPSGDGCTVHRHSGEFLAALGGAERIELRSNILRMEYAGRTKALIFRINSEPYGVAVDLDEDGKPDVGVEAIVPVASEAFARSGAHGYLVRGVRDIRVLTGTEVAGFASETIPLLRGDEIAAQPDSSQQWTGIGQLAERAINSSTEQSVWLGPWADGSPFHVGVAVKRPDGTHYGWVRVRVLVHGPDPDIRVLDFALNPEPDVPAVAGIR